MSVEKQLLFGILALQNNFVSRETLLAAFNVWVVKKARPLGEILFEQGKLDQLQHDLLNALTDQHIKQHNNDPEQSLAVLSSIDSVRDDLQKLGDPQLDASLAIVSLHRPGPDPYATETFSAGEWSATGQRFRVLRPHARGGLGEVFVARDMELNREVALKQIQSQHADEQHSRSRFLVEAEITGGLEHPGIVPVYGLGQYADGRPFYAMRFIRGDSLRDAIERFHQADKSPRDPGDRIVELRKLLGRFIDVCEAMEYAHSRGVLHRDLKPGNIMLGRYGETLVVDWGLAKAVGHSESDASNVEGVLHPSGASGSDPTTMGTAIGTPAYMSPEQAEGRLDLLGPTSDVYGLGATLYHLLTGEAPVTSEDLNEVLGKVQRGVIAEPRQRNAQVPPALSAICKKAMALKQKERYSSPRALANDIEHWLADEPVACYAEPLSHRARRWLMRHRMIVASSAAAVLVLIISLAGLLALVTTHNKILASKNQQLANANQAERNATYLAERNADVAREQSQLALESLKTVVFDIQRELEKVPRAGELRRKLLNTALTNLQEVSDRFASRQDIDRSTLVALNDLGDVFMRISSPIKRSHRDEKLAGPEKTALTSSSFAGQLTTAHKLYQRAFEIAQKRAAAYPKSAEVQHDLATSYEKLGSVMRQSAKLGEALKHYQKLLEYSVKTAADNPQNVLAQRALAASHDRLGEVLLRSGNFTAAEEHYQQVLTITQKLTAFDPHDVQGQRDLFGSLIHLGDVLVESGNPTKALEYFQKSQEISQKLVAANPGDADVQRQLSISCERLGDVLLRSGKLTDGQKQYREALEINKKLVEADPGDLQAQRDLTYAYDKLSQSLLRSRKLTEARELCQQALKTQQELAAADPNDAQAQRELAIAFAHFGDVLYRTNKVTAALEECEKGLEIFQKLAAADQYDARAQNDLATAYLNLGSLQAHCGRLTEAKNTFQKGLQICEELAATDPRDTRADRSLSISYEQLGDILLQSGQLTAAQSQYRRSLQIRQRLAMTDLRDSEAQRDLSVAYLSLGNALLQAGNLTDAQQNYQQCLVMREKLAGADPEDARAQQDLSYAFEKVGDVLREFQRLTEALTAYQKCMEIRQKLVDADPHNIVAKRYLSTAIERLGMIHEQSGDLLDARNHYERMLLIKKQIADDDPADSLAQREMCVTLQHMGNVLLQSGNFGEAHKQFQQMLELSQKLATIDPNDSQAQRDLAYSYDRLGALLYHTNKLPESKGQYELGLEIFHRLAQADPSDARAQRDLALAYENIGNVMLQSAEFSQAKENFQKRLEISQKLARESSNALTQHDLMVAHYRLGDVYKALSRFDEASKEYRDAAVILRQMIKAGMDVEKSQRVLVTVERAVAIAEHADIVLGDWNELLKQPEESLPALLEMRGMELLNSGRFSEAAQAAQKLRQMPQATSEQLYNTACIFSLCAAAIRPAEGESLSNEESRQRQQHLSDGVSTLKLAINAGMKDYAHIQTDTDLNVLRDLPEFKKLLESGTNQHP